MKNIHLIPTDKPSRLAKHSSGSFHIVSYIAHKKGLYKMTNQHIYITNDEEIKEGDWFYDLDTKYVKVNQSWKNSNLDLNGKKIILTTDPDLIKDGVQSIEDTFLEWFVKNPSCEFVEVEKKDNWYTHTGSGKYWEDEPVRMKRLLNLGDYEYKIIIPQEEPKKEVTGVDDNRPKPNYCYAKEQGHGEIGCVFPACHCGLPIKQETLEEVEENIDREEWINFFKNNSKEEILEYLINYKFPL
jgi:hypothetical protein